MLVLVLVLVLLVLVLVLMIVLMIVPREDNFTTAMAVLQNAGDAAKGDTRGKKGGMKEGSNIFKIVKMIMERSFAPVIVFSFSKKECEAYALQMAK